MLKEEFTPAGVNQLYFWLAPSLAMLPALFTICVVPFGSTHPITLPWGYTMKSPGVIADVGIGVLLVFALASLSVYGIVLAGLGLELEISFPWRHPLQRTDDFLRGLHGPLSHSHFSSSWAICGSPTSSTTRPPTAGPLLPFFTMGWPLHNWQSYVLWIPMVISFVIFLVSAFAETNRLPFDLPESETELVGGYHTEYAAMKFALFFLGEYAAMIVASCIMVTLFLGGWSLPWQSYIDLQSSPWSLLIFPVVFLLKMCVFIVFFIWVRWTLPRFRYDQLMGLGWKCILPIALANIMLTCILLAIPGMH